MIRAAALAALIGIVSCFMIAGQGSLNHYLSREPASGSCGSITCSSIAMAKSRKAPLSIPVVIPSNAPNISKLLWYADRFHGKFFVAPLAQLSAGLDTSAYARIVALFEGDKVATLPLHHVDGHVDVFGGQLSDIFNRDMANARELSP